MHSTITGKTRVVGVMGNPVSHSLSPQMHNYWYKKYAIDAVYIPVQVAPENFASTVKSFASAGFAGVNVTIPHKTAAYEICDFHTEAATKTAAVNCLIFNDGKITGDNTDADGFISAFNPDKYNRAIVLGAGGASSAVIYALKSHGITKITLYNRTLSKAEEVANRYGVKAEILSSLMMLSEKSQNDTIVVNCTPSGMQGKEELEFDISFLGKNCLVYDLVYNPPLTKLLKTAKKNKIQYLNGLSMLIGQGALSVRNWFGILPEQNDDLMSYLESQL